MKLMYLVLSCLLLLQTACLSQGSEVTTDKEAMVLKVKESEPIVYHEIDGNGIKLKEGEIPVRIRDEKGRTLIRVYPKARASTGPVYECVCGTTGDCCLPKADMPRGKIVCDCEQKECLPPVGGLNHLDTGCKFRLVSNVSNYTEIRFHDAAQSIFAGLREFNESGFRPIGSFQLELKNKDVAYEKIQLENGSSAIEFKATGVRVQCVCTCPAGGDCNTFGYDNVLFCESGANLCAMAINGEVCSGCDWQIVPDNIKSVGGGKSK